jgi:hypothetical protein
VGVAPAAPFKRESDFGIPMTPIPIDLGPTMGPAGFIESILRSYSRDPTPSTPINPKGFMGDLVHKIMNLITLRILTPLPANVRLELLKKNSVLFPTTQWARENDLEKFKNWLVELTSWISGNGWKGAGYNELHIDALAHALDGDPKQIVLHDVKQGFERAPHLHFYSF